MEEKIKEIAENLVLRNDMIERKIKIKEIYISLGRNNFIRIYLDKDKGVTIDDCAYYHREFITLLNIEGIENENFTIEVSSPGTENKK